MLHYDCVEVFLSSRGVRLSCLSVVTDSMGVPVTLGPFPHLQCGAVTVGIAVDPFHAQHHFNSVFIVDFPKTQAEIAHRV